MLTSSTDMKKTQLKKALFEHTLLEKEVDRLSSLLHLVQPALNKLVVKEVEETKKEEVEEKKKEEKKMEKKEVQSTPKSLQEIPHDAVVFSKQGNKESILETSMSVESDTKLSPVLTKGPRDKKKKEENSVEQVVVYDDRLLQGDETVWVPPAGQTGDGRTALNDKWGY